MTTSKHELHGATCICGWEAALGVSIWRAFDRHLLEERDRDVVTE